MSDSRVDFLLGIVVGIGIGIAASTFGASVMVAMVWLQFGILGYAILRWRSGGGR